MWGRGLRCVTAWVGGWGALLPCCCSHTTTHTGEQTFYFLAFMCACVHGVLFMCWLLVALHLQPLHHSTQHPHTTFSLPDPLHFQCTVAFMACTSPCSWHARPVRPCTRRLFIRSPPPSTASAGNGSSLSPARFGREEDARTPVRWVGSLQLFRVGERGQGLGVSGVGCVRRWVACGALPRCCVVGRGLVWFLDVGMLCVVCEQ